ncbi:MAG: hypothetical protein NTY98_01145 [Verrucomicrobia bacterium]|nr:hypothetical protein [Verrucomicrobiota bacterium]
MAISTKNRRKLIHNGSEFIWWVAEDEDWQHMILHVVTHDKSFIARYTLAQKDQDREIRAEAGGPYQWFRCPCFDPQGIVTPGSVSQLIDWCYAALTNVVPNP